MATAFSVQSARALSSGTAFCGLFILRKCATKTARNGAPFLMVELGDKTGTLGTTVFSDSPVFASLTALKEGAIVRVEAVSENFQGRFSPRLGGVEEVPESGLDAADLDGLVETAPEDLVALWTELNGHVAAVEHAGLRTVVASVFEEIGGVFRVCAAAVAMHHAYRGGLLEHTVHMARVARAVLPLYPQVDASLALSGVLLHDVGKTLEYCNGLVTRRTRLGILQGHVVLGYQLVRKHGLKNKLAVAWLERLEHIILSHQGEMEWGAAAMAASPEAVFVSMVDNLDAKMGMVQRALRGAAPGEEFSDYMPGLKASLLLTPLPSQE
ncbi:MAG: HD domain-containing protein [Puniceicoccales bacterium]|nr:HD domain-containing protein [Puniceicoccales bacterium]